jgi:hypothetical protein
LATCLQSSWLRTLQRGLCLMLGRKADYSH